MTIKSKSNFYRQCVWNLVSGWLQIGHKLKKAVTPQFVDMMSSSIFLLLLFVFWCCCVFLVKFSYCSKFHVNIITGSGIMTIFINKELTKNPEMGNTPIWDLSSIWRLWQVKDTKFGKNVSNVLLNNAKCQGYSVYHFWVIKVKPTGG